MSVALSANPVQTGTSPAAIVVTGCTSACGTMTYLMDGAVFEVLSVNADGTVSFPPISSSLAVGSHTLTVQYGGNGTYAATSASYPFTVVSAAPTSLSLSLDVTPVPVNETPHMGGQLGCNSACGVVTFAIDGTVFQNSTATSTGVIGNLLKPQSPLPYSQIPLGWHILTVSYPGSGSYTSSSTSIAFHVVPDTLPPASLAVSLTSSPYVAGASPNAMAVVGCNYSCGYLSWYVDGALFQYGAIGATGGLNTTPLINGETIAVGSHTLTVSYSGNGQYAPSTASYAFNAVATAPTTLTLSLAQTTVPIDETPAMSGQLGCNTSCGTVYYYIDGTIFQNSAANSTGAVSNLLQVQAPLPYSQIPLGWHILTESYPGNSTYSASNISIPFQIAADTLPVPSLTATLPSNPVILGTAPNVTTTVGCNSCGYFSWYMDGSLFQYWAVSSNGVDAPSIVNGSALTSGPHTITVKFSGNAQYAPATMSLSFVVTAATHGIVPTITWPQPAAVSYGTALSATQLNATATSSGATIPGTFTYSPASGTLAATGSDVLTVTFTPNDKTTYTQGAQSVVLKVNRALPSISWSAPAAIPYGTQLTSTQLNATSPVAGTMTYSPTMYTIPAAGTSQITATFTPNDYVDYATATQTVGLTVNKGTPTITWQTPQAIRQGTALGTTQLNATASVPGTFAYTPASGTVPAAGNQTLSVTLTPTDATDYSSVTATIPLAVDTAAPTLSLSSSAASSAYAAPLVITATLSSGPTGVVTFFDGGVAIGTGTISGITATLTNPALKTGSHSVTASWPGNTLYLPAASSSTLTQVITQATPAITWASPASITDKTPLSATQLNATTSAVGGGTFTYSPAIGTLLAQGSDTLQVTFNPTDTTDYVSTTATTTISVTPLYDHGVVSLKINGVLVASTSYGSSDTPGSVVWNLAKGLVSGQPYTLTPVFDGIYDGIYIQTTQTGSGTDLSYNISATSTDPTDFPVPSFIPVPITGTLEGGAAQSSSGAVIYSYTMTPSSGTSGYAANGNLLYINDSVMGVWNYQYDGLNRVSMASQAPASGSTQYYCWSYDSFGNRTAQALSNAAFTNSVGATTCQAASNATLTNNWATFDTYNHIATDAQLSGGLSGTSANAPGDGVNDATWNGIYDTAGNVIADGSNQYLYDAEGRVCAVQGGPLGWIGYQYDADGNRIGKGTITSWSCDITSNGYTPTNDYVLDQSGGQMTEMAVGQNGTMAWQHTNVTANGSLIATYDANGLHFYLNDPLGSRRVQATSAGVLEQTCQSLPFGDGLSCTGSIDAPTEHHFTGKERDTESGLDYFGARYYASNMGRFMSPDPTFLNIRKLFNPQRWNLYSYALNDPLGHLDPDGNEAIAIAYPGYQVGVHGNFTLPLGHGGVVLVDRDGTTHYFEYGRYQGPDGVVRNAGSANAATPSVQRDASGNITPDSMNNLLQTLSTASGKGGPVDALVIPTNSAEDENILTYLKARQAENGDPNREKYSLWGGHNCGTLACDALSHAHMPSLGRGSMRLTTPYQNFLQLWALYGNSSAWEYQPKEHTTSRIIFPVPSN